MLVKFTVGSKDLSCVIELIIVQFTDVYSTYNNKYNPESIQVKTYKYIDKLISGK